MTRRRLAAIVVALAALPAAPAQADLVLNPAAVFAVGSQPMQVAQGIARQHWGVDPCGGQVAISWTVLAPQINATSTWTNPISSYDNPSLNGSCQIQFNSGMDFDWGKFCTVVVHEYGHLSGKPHSPDPHDVMAAYYADALPECVNAAGAAGMVQPISAQAPVDSQVKAPAQAARVAATAPASTRAAAQKKTSKRASKKAKKSKHHRATKHKKHGAKARSARVLIFHHAD